MRMIVLEGLIVLVMMLCMVACGNQADSTPAEEQGKTSVVAQKVDPQISEDDKKETEDNSKTTAADETETVSDAEGGKVLVAYFSATGTTKKLAEYAAEVTGADLYEIVPAEPYSDADLDWNDKNSRTSIEMNHDSVRPAINGSVSDMESYTIVFIGYPIWWGDAPHIIDTFMGSYDFSGKTIVPFCTSGSSGIGSSAEELHDYTDESVTWLDGERLKSGSSKEDIASWISGLSLGIEVRNPMSGWVL